MKHWTDITEAEETLDEAATFSLSKISDHLKRVVAYAREVEGMITDKQAMFRVEQDAPGALNALMRSIDSAYMAMGTADGIATELRSFARGERGAEGMLTHLARRAGRAYAGQTRKLFKMGKDVGTPFNLAQQAKAYEALGFDDGEVLSEDKQALVRSLESLASDYRDIATSASNVARQLKQGGNVGGTRQPRLVEAIGNAMEAGAKVGEMLKDIAFSFRRAGRR